MMRTPPPAVTAGSALAVLVLVGSALTLLPAGADPVPVPTYASAPTPTPTPTPPATTVPANTATPLPAGGTSLDDAIAIALARTGGDQVTDVEREIEHGRVEWKVRVLTGDGERRIRIDADTGAVTRSD
jgi:Peptidase propeptide and YPEB domain